MKLRLLCAVLLANLMAVLAHAGTVTGTIQRPNGQPLANGVVTFSLSQSGVTQSGAITVTADNVYCGTSSTGTVVGVTDPAASPALSANYGAGTLPATQYYVEYTYTSASGESFTSRETTFLMTGSGTLNGNAPSLQPGNATGYKVYIGTTSGGETLQQTVVGFAGWSQSAALGAGTPPPLSNSTLCNTLIFNDAITPSYTTYLVNLLDSKGKQVAGYPQRYYFSGTTVDLSTLAPSANLYARFPTAIVAQPGGNGLQSIAGPLSIGTNQFTAGTGKFSGSITTPGLNNIAYVDGQHYPQTGAGLSQAITDSIANGSREVHVCGTISISTTINLTTGGVSIIGCGSGGINNSFVPTAMLQWTGAAGSDLLQITGQANPRMDKVKLQNLILDGGGTARYDLRMEKVDIVSLYDVRFRNAATAGLYAVDATGIAGVNVNCGTIASYCMVLDWGTGGSIFTGIQVENDVSSTLPLILLQGASRGITFNGFQCDGTNTSFGGCIQITGYDANSSFASAPTGGAGAPQSVKITNPVVTIHAAATTPSQGADILITGTATNQSSHISIEGLNDLGGTVSASAVKIDQANNVEIYDGISSSHTVASLNVTANATKVRQAFFQSFSDTASCTGSGCSTLLTLAVTTATGTATVDLASVASGACTADSADVTLTGAAVGDPVRVTAATALPAGVWLIGRVTASNTGRFQLCNLSGGAVDRASDTYTISVVK